MRENREELIERAIEQMFARGIDAEDAARIYDLKAQEIELLKAAKRVSSIASPVSLSLKTKNRMLRRIRKELRLKRTPGIFKRVAVAFSTLVVATGGISYAAYKAPPDSFLYRVRDVVEEATFLISSEKEERAKKILESAGNHAELASKYRKKNRDASVQAYETAKRRLNEYLELKKSLGDDRDLSDFEEKISRKYIEVKRKIAPRETTIILETEKETPPPSAIKQKKESPAEVTPPALETNDADKTNQDFSNQRPR